MAGKMSEDDSTVGCDDRTIEPNSFKNLIETNSQELHFMRFWCLAHSELGVQLSASRSGSVATLEDREDADDTRTRRDSLDSSTYIQMPLTIHVTPALDVGCSSLKKYSGGASSLLNQKFGLIEQSNTTTFDQVVDLQSEIQCESVEGDNGHTEDQVQMTSESSVVVAIDFGTMNCSYGYAFLAEPSKLVMMRSFSENSFKIPTTALFDQNKQFHSFGYDSHDFYNNMDPRESKSWLLFEQFKMSLYQPMDLSEYMVKATNGVLHPALQVFSASLGWLKNKIMAELNDQSGWQIKDDDIKWVLTVPAIWCPQAKSLMREAAYQAGLASRDASERLLIALEPEAASIYIQQLRINRPDANSDPDLRDENLLRTLNGLMACGTRYVVVDCGGGTIDITVHEIVYDNGGKSLLKEIYKASGGPFGSTGVDNEFEKLLAKIFGQDFLANYRAKFPSGHSMLMKVFERRKIGFEETTSTFVSIELPYSFINAYKKFKGESVVKRVKAFNKLSKDRSNGTVEWSDQGILRLSSSVMRGLFSPIVESICDTLQRIITHPHVQNVDYLFLVGGFAASSVLQQEIRRKYADKMQIIIPSDASLCVLKGAIMFGIDSSIVRIRKSRSTFGIGCLERFDASKHCQSKQVTRNGQAWCRDVFDKFVLTDQCIAADEIITRFYAPINRKNDRREITINLYSSDSREPQYVTDSLVKKCGKLVLRLDEDDDDEIQVCESESRRIRVDMSFGDTELKARAVDEQTGKMIQALMRF